MIDHNTITGTGIDGIGFDGDGTQIIGNYVTGCHCWNVSQGGQIGSYYGTTRIGNGVGVRQVVVGNTIGPPGSLAQGTGLEAWNPGMIVSGNSFEGILGAAITVVGIGTTITGNSIRDCGGTADAIVILGGVTDFVISGNRIADDKTTPTMRYGVSIYTGASDRYTITGNLISGNTSLAVSDQGTGTHKLIANNLGNNDGAIPLHGNSTLNGRLVITPDNTGVSALILDGTVQGQARSISYTTGGVSRFQSGMMYGTNNDDYWAVVAYDNTGAYAYGPLTITRATGAVTVGSLLNVGAGYGSPQITVNGAAGTNKGQLAG